MENLCSMCVPEELKSCTEPAAFSFVGSECVENLWNICTLKGVRTQISPQNQKPRHHQAFIFIILSNYIIHMEKTLHICVHTLCMTFYLCVNIPIDMHIYTD